MENILTPVHEWFTKQTIGSFVDERAGRDGCAPPTPIAASCQRQKRGSRPLATMGLPCCAVLCPDVPRPLPR